MNSINQDNSDVFVTFSGGLGAQIFSAAIYFSLQSKGRTIFADLSYFNQPAKTAIVGNKGEVSQWTYELSEYGLPLQAFATKPIKKAFFKRNMPEIIADGARKVELAIEAIRQREIKDRFPIPQNIIKECQQITGSNDYLCIHIRRGDYVNVASHLVDDLDFVNLAKSISSFVTHAVVISDSEVSNIVSDKLNALFPNWSIIVGGNLHVAHALIRGAKYLICSNSQFSLSAALLNENGQQIFLPTQWFGDVDTDIQIPINALCRFQILNVA
jgi:Glycosyl transferase family 11